MRKTTLLAVVIILLAVGLVWWAGALTRPEEGNPPAGGGTTTPTSTNGGAGAPSVVNRVKIALMDPEKKQGTKERGCDTVVMVDRNIAPTTAPLSAAMTALFAERELWLNGLYNFISKTRDTLSFDRAEVSDGTARIYLKGRLSGLAGVCDDPRARAQIEETALQFPTVERVEIYLNEVRDDLTPDLQG